MPPTTDADTKSDASQAPAVPTPKPGDRVLFWPARLPFIQHAFAAEVMDVPEPEKQDAAAPRAQLLVTNHQTGRTFNVDSAAYSAEPAPGSWGLPKANKESTDAAAR